MNSKVKRSSLKLPRPVIDPKRKAQFGQFFTPGKIAEFMANLFAPRTGARCHLLDAGAGIGSLSEAFLDRWTDDNSQFISVDIDAFEIDELLSPSLTQTLEKYNNRPSFNVTIRTADFIQVATDWLSGSLFAEELPKYTHAILNPPYKKIRNDSTYRAALRQAGIETVNLYTAFVALSLSLLEDQGQLVAIIPRSFCNGTYYRSFRDFVLQRAAVRHIHLFKSRNNAFKDDGVLQENIIVLLERGGTQGPVGISTSTDAAFTDLDFHEHPFNQIVSSSDRERFIHIPTSPEQSTLQISPNIRHSLYDIGVSVSTGPVIDFRLKAYLRDMPAKDTAPLIYPSHCNRHGMRWPISGTKKPNAIQRNENTEKWLYPNGFYCLVRRFSSKEEKYRVVASVVNPTTFAQAPMLGFENHLNVFHENKQGLPETLARGLAVFLNTTAVDEYFRCFNGHTQVNATDLRLMKYPPRDSLVALGEWAMEQGKLKQTAIDDKLKSIIT